nr:LysR family substrate-binding domain-containing protein [Brevibacillus invocatus]
MHNLGGITYKSLWIQPYSIILPEDHPLADQTDLNIAQLAQEPFVMLEREESPQGYDYVLSLCAKHGFSPRIVSQASRTDAVLMIVDAGIGITILSHHLLLYASPSLRFIDIQDEEHQVDIVASWKTANENPSVPLFIQEVETALQRLESRQP